MKKMEKFGKRIRSIREAARKSMKDASIIMDISVVEYSDIERSRREPPLGEPLRKLALFLGVDPQEMRDWAVLERKRAELSLEGKSQTVIDCALVLGDRWEKITDDEAVAILEVLSPPSPSPAP